MKIAIVISIILAGICSLTIPLVSDSKEYSSKECHIVSSKDCKDKVQLTLDNGKVIEVDSEEYNSTKIGDTKCQTTYTTKAIVMMILGGIICFIVLTIATGGEILGAIIQAI